jgi:hypothetical protein
LRRAIVVYILGMLVPSLASLGAADLQGVSTRPRLGIGLSGSPQAGILFSGAPDLGWSGLSAEAMLTWSAGMLHVEAGIEAGQSPIGWQVLAPVRGGARFALPPFTLEALAEAAPGAALFQQGPLFMIGVGALGRAVWNLSAHFGFSASVGVRWTLSPGYASSTGHVYSTLDMPLTAGARLSF